MDVVIISLHMTSNVAGGKKKKKSPDQLSTACVVHINPYHTLQTRQMEITQVPKSHTDISLKCGEHRHITTGHVQIIFGSGWKKQHLTCGLEVGGREGGGVSERWRQSPPVSRAKQHHGNGPAP